MASAARDLRYRPSVDGSLARELDWAVRERELRHAGEAPRHPAQEQVRTVPRTHVRVRERQRVPVMAMLGFTAVLGLAVCAVVGVLLLRGLAEVLDMLEELAAAGGLPEGLFTPLVKTLGIALVSRLGGEICRDAGQGAMAAVLDTAGAFGAVLVSLPLVRAAWELLRTLV